MRAALWLDEKPAGLYDMQDVLGAEMIRCAHRLPCARSGALAGYFGWTGRRFCVNFPLVCH